MSTTQNAHVVMSKPLKRIREMANLIWK